MTHRMRRHRESAAFSVERLARDLWEDHEVEPDTGGAIPPHR